MNQLFRTSIPSPIDDLILISDGSFLIEIWMGSAPSTGVFDPSLAVFMEAKRQLDAYFGQELREFDLPLRASGTEFQKTVWRALLEIPYGTTCSYGELARRIGQPTAPRAVGLANGKNPLPIVVPCHRVIGANGKLVGFGGGLPRKVYLLDLERGFV